MKATPVPFHKILGSHNPNPNPNPNPSPKILMPLVKAYKKN